MTGISVSGPRPDNLKAGLLLVLASLIFTVEIVLLRLLDGRVAFSQVVLFRSLAQLVFAGFWAAKTAGWATLRTRRPGLHLLRGLFSLACWWLYYASFAGLGIALATVLAFTSSLFVVLLAGPVMGEKVGLRRGAATFIGFIGVIIAAGLTDIRIEPGVLMALLSAACGAGIVLSNRSLAATETTHTIMIWIGIITLIGCAPVALWEGAWPQGTDILILSCGSLAGCWGMWCTIEAYRTGEVSALAAVPYIRLIFAVLAGYLLFGEIPALHFWPGAALIVAGALLIALKPSR